LGLARSSYYYEARGREDEEVVRLVEEVAQAHATYGTRRVTHQVRRECGGLRINRKQVQRIMRERDLLQQRKRRGQGTTNSAHGFQRFANLVRGLKVARPDQLWVADITYIRLGRGFVYLAVVMDVYTRLVRGWRLSRSLDEDLSLSALRHALETGAPTIHHSDQGIHYANPMYVGLLRSRGVHISMTAPGHPEENGYAERVIRTIKEEEVDLSEYDTFQDAYEQIGAFIEDVYNVKRIHSSLGYRTPLECEQAYQQTYGVPLSQP
jgi:transposase InsO family protein